MYILKFYKQFDQLNKVEIKPWLSFDLKQKKLEFT